jgi:hypothetical protein
MTPLFYLMLPSYAHQPNMFYMYRKQTDLRLSMLPELQEENEVFTVYLLFKGKV